MTLFILILVIAIHTYTLYDAFISFNKKDGGFRFVLALFPPVIGPVIYYLTKPKPETVRKNSFFNRSPFRLRSS